MENKTEDDECDVPNGIDRKGRTMDDPGDEKFQNYDELYDEGNESLSLCDIPNEIYPQTDPVTENGNSEINDARFNLRKKKLTGSSQDLNMLSDNIDFESDDDNNEVDKKKIRKKIQHNYTDGMLQEALDVVQSQNVSIMHAAKQFGIPRSTLRRYALMVWAAATRKTKGKHETALTPNEESYLVSMITKMSLAGKYVSTMDVKSTVQYLLDRSQRIVFKDRNRPNAGWVQRFRKRHKNLQINGSGYTLKRHGPLCSQDVVEWQTEISRYLKNEWEINDEDILNDNNSHRIFNLDEMTLSMNYRQDLITENITSTRGFEDVYTEVTIMAAVSADGEFTQPLIIQKGEGGGHEDDIMPLDQNSYGISFSISGKMNADIFLRWLEAFDKELAEKGVEKPIIVFLDDIFAHFHISVFSFAIDNGIILLCLPCQPLCLMHPIQGEIFDKVREAYRIFCREHYQTSFQPVTVDQFPETFLQAWETVRDDDLASERLSSSFHNYGLVPLNSNAFGLADLFTLAEKEHKDALMFKADAKPVKIYKRREQKAKKTLGIKKRKLTQEPASLLPTVKIRKLEPVDDCDNISLHEDDVNLQIGAVATSTESANVDSTKMASCSSNPFLSFKPEEKGQAIHSVISSDRISGRLDGMQKCMELMESFIPPDIISIWQKRDEQIKSCSEIPFCMWKAVTSLCSETSIEVNKKSSTSNKGFLYYP